MDWAKINAALTVIIIMIMIINTRAQCVNTIKKHLGGQDVFTNMNGEKNNGQYIRAGKQLISTNMNKSDASWYDTVYHGGMLTVLPRVANLHGTE
jgi:hypothetical protein